jgi:hypothetical protein
VIQTIPNTGIEVDVDWSHVEEKHDLTFVGSIRTADRKWYVEKLKANDIPIQVLGEGAGGYVSFHQMLDIYRTSKINLNFSKTVSERGLRQIKGRVFQVCMAGGFLLTEYAPGIEKYFELGREIVCFDSPREMVDHARYYLTYEAERRAIARAGWERAKEEYSSCRMVAKVFDEIEKDLARGATGGAPPGRLNLSIGARRVLATYHLVWSRAQIEENDTRGLWKDDIALTLSYIPWHALARFYRFLPSLPWSIRHSVFNGLRRMESRRFSITAADLRTVWQPVKSFLGRMAEGLLRIPR